MATLEKVTLPSIRKETDSVGEVDVAADVLWGARTQRSLEHFSIGDDLIPRGMITAYAILKKAAAAEIAKLTSLPFVTAPNKFTVQGAHDALVQLSGTLRTLGVSLYKITNDIRLMSCGPRAGFAEPKIPESFDHAYANPSNCFSSVRWLLHAGSAGVLAKPTTRGDSQRPRQPRDG